MLGRLLEEVRSVLQDVLGGLLFVLARMRQRLLGGHLVALLLEPRIGLRSARRGLRRGLQSLDIDNFKSVNDTHGHLTGDNVLRAVARVLRQSSRDVDEPARYGGEEMAVALPLTDLEGAYQFAERVRGRIEALELPLPDGKGALKVTASFGVASLATADGASKSALVAAADGALYEAKRSGKNRTVRATAATPSSPSVHGVASGE